MNRIYVYILIISLVMPLTLIWVGGVPPTEVKLIPLDVRERSGRDLHNYTVSVYLRNCDNYEAIDEEGNVLNTFCDHGRLWIKVPWIPANGNVTVYLRKGKPGRAQDVFLHYDGFDTLPDYRLVDYAFVIQGKTYYWYPYVVGNEKTSPSLKVCKKVKVFTYNGELRATRYDICELEILLRILKVPDDAGIRVDFRGTIMSKSKDKDLSLGLFGFSGPTSMENVTSDVINRWLGFYHYYHYSYTQSGDSGWRFALYKEIYRKGFSTYNTLKIKRTRLAIDSPHVYGVAYFNQKVYGFVDEKLVISAESGKFDNEYVGVFIGFDLDLTGAEYELGIRPDIIGSADWIMVRKFVDPEPRVTIKEPILPQTPSQTQTTQTQTEEQIEEMTKSFTVITETVTEGSTQWTPKTEAQETTTTQPTVKQQEEQSSPLETTVKETSQVKETPSEVTITTTEQAEGVPGAELAMPVMLIILIVTALLLLGRGRRGF